MINRELLPVQVISYAEGKDAYGQKRKNGSSSRTIEMVIKPYLKNNIDNVLYVDTTDIGLTYDRDITDKDQIKFNDTTYQILYVIHSHRLTQVLMKRV